MSAPAFELDRILQRDWRRNLIRRLGSEPWLVVYDELGFMSGIYCALVPTDSIADVLSTPAWDLHKGDGRPEITRDEESHAYWRFGNFRGIEPLVYRRDYYGVRPSHLELSEEFRHFHNLFYDSERGEFMKVLDDGTEEVVARLRETSCEVRSREVRQFLAIKRMHLAVYFQIWLESSIALADLPQDEIHELYTDPLTIYEFEAAPIERTDAPAVRTLSKLIGKKLVPPLPLERCGIWPYDEDEKNYPSFIIRTDSDGRPVEHSCDPDRLANAFGANPGAPFDLTPVFFRKDVLNKYYANPKKYTVEDGRVACASLWCLNIDNNHPDYVVVWLYKLGRELPPGERAYWRSFNIAPDGRGISEVNYRRNILAEWTDAQAPDLVFKESYRRLAKKWEERFGWSLFRPLPEADAYCLSALRQVVVDDQAEFDLQVRNLTKVLVDSINEDKVVTRPPGKKENEKGISKLQRFLEAEGLPSIDTHIGFLRDLQEVRSSGASHRKGRKYEKVAARLGIGKKSLPRMFDELLDRGTALLDWLKEWCEAKPESTEDHKR